LTLPSSYIAALLLTLRSHLYFDGWVVLSFFVFIDRTINHFAVVEEEEGKEEKNDHLHEA